MNLDVTTGELDLGENSLYQMYLDKLRTKYAGHPTVTDADLQEAARQGVGARSRLDIHSKHVSQAGNM